MDQNIIDDLENEKQELSEKIDNLRDYLNTDELVFEEITPDQRAILKIQLSAMETYKICLEQRIELL